MFCRCSGDAVEARDACQRAVREYEELVAVDAALTNRLRLGGIALRCAEGWLAPTRNAEHLTGAKALSQLLNYRTIECTIMQDAESIRLVLLLLLLLLRQGTQQTICNISFLISGVTLHHEFDARHNHPHDSILPTPSFHRCGTRNQTHTLAYQRNSLGRLEVHDRISSARSGGSPEWLARESEGRHDVGCFFWCPKIGQNQQW